MTKQMITALALVALGLTGIFLALYAAFQNVILPAEHPGRVDDETLTHIFLIFFVGGFLLLCLGACRWDDARQEQKEDRELNQRRERKAA